MKRTRSGTSWITSIFHNNNLKNEVNICRSGHSDSFEKASTYLSTVISQLLPATNTSLERYGRRSQVNSVDRGGRVVRGSWFEGRGGRGRGGWEGRGGNQSKNEVDISNPTRWYGKEEWSRLSCNTQQHILKDPAIEQAENERHGKKNKTTNTTASVNTNKVNPKHNRLVAAIINGILNASQHKHLQSTLMIRYSPNGSRITLAENVNNDNNSGSKNDTSVITYDHLGRPLLLGTVTLKIS